MASFPIRPGRRRLSAMLFAGAAAIIVTAGCGTVGYSEGTGDRTKGKDLFVAKCGSCHVLADAGTKGEIGPDLDYAFYESRRNGLGESTIVQVVRGQIAYPVTNPPSGAPGMPADLVVGQDAEDVASYVAGVAGLTDPARTTPAPAPTPTTPAPPVDGGGAAGDAAAGKQVFASAGCGGCHALADAGATGTVGPSLDDAKPDAALVTERVTNGQGAMPSFKGQLDEKQIADVAAYVSSVAGS